MFAVPTPITTRDQTQTESGFCIWIPESEKFGWWNPESWALEVGIQLKESRIPLLMTIQNPSSTEFQYQESSIQGVESRI